MEYTTVNTRPTKHGAGERGIKYKVWLPGIMAVLWREGMAAGVTGPSDKRYCFSEILLQNVNIYIFLKKKGEKNDSRLGERNLSLQGRESGTPVSH